MLDLAELKKKHRIIFCLELAGYEIVFRLPSWREHNIYRKLFLAFPQRRGKLEDQIFRDLCLDEIFIDEMNQIPAGLVSSVVEIALLLSGNDLKEGEEKDLLRINEDLQGARLNLENNIYEQFILHICQAFRSLNPQEVEDLPYHEVLRLVVMAEKILELPEPLNVLPREEKRLTDRIFEDAAGAAQLDMDPNERGNPSPVQIRDALANQNDPERAKQLQMIKMLQERRRKEDA